MILSVSMLLRWLGEFKGNLLLSEAGELINKTVDTIIGDPETRTVDLGGNLGCKAFGDLVARSI